MMKIYVYAIIDSNDQISESLHGLEKADVYNIPFRDIGVVASDHTGPMPDVTEDNILAHEYVVESMMENFTVLPVKSLTIFDARENVLSVMGDYYTDFKDNLNRLRNKVEFGIKVIWPGDKIKEHLIKTHKGDAQKVPVSGGSPRKRFMKEKFEKYKIDKKFREKASKCINAMDVFFSKFAAQKKLEKLRTDNLLLSAVYLVEKDKQNNFREAFEHIRTARDDFRYLFSGPWPPYNFVILPKKSHPLKNSEQANMFDKVIQEQNLIGADKT
jgi:hypothetical protein